MAAVTNAKTSLPRDLVGVNLTDATYQVLIAGAGNGAQFTFLGTDIVILKNDSGGAATYTFKVIPSVAQAAAGATVTSPTVVVANNKSVALRLDDIFKNANGIITIECDVAGKLLVLNAP